MPRIFLLFLSCLAIPACSIPAFLPREIASETIEISGQTMGTTYSVKIVVAANEEEKRHAVRDEFAPVIQQTLDEINARMSTYKSDSDVSRFNASESLDWFAVAPITAEVVLRGQLIAQKTGGAFDMTCAPLVALWGFGAAAKKNVSEKSTENSANFFAIPTDEEVQKVRARVGYEKLEVRLESPALKKSIPSLTIDLSAIAKGFAVDEVARRLRELGEQNFMVEVGGEVYCRGFRTLWKNPNGANPQTAEARVHAWRIGIKSPRTLDEPQELQRVQYLHNAALATSGDYHNYIASADGTFSHLIDPRTGYPPELVCDATSRERERLGSVSVIHENCTTADAFATAFFVLGEEAGIAFAEQEQLQVKMLLRRAEPHAPVRERNNLWASYQ